MLVKREQTEKENKRENPWEGLGWSEFDSIGPNSIRLVRIFEGN
jgi:hypothetical protein